ncbi:hypothetical protein [Cobetia sp. AM6]|uniref:hypothetical protein n=1 Tax=Cobetia sp. AM6 TaxID=2661553 RepID=UPI00129935C0|nr:hypothetical protein [Cobetia sp. AM6]BBO57035.1 hypothetical protein CLAM6_23460 [Cobetia sp. AM6]
MSIFKKLYTADSELKSIGIRVEESYRKAERTKSVSKGKIILVLETFLDLYNSISSSGHDRYFIGNLIGTGRIEGTSDEVFGTVENAVQRTKSFIEHSEYIYASQCSFYSRNLKVILEQGSFRKNPQEIIGDRRQKLQEISLGSIN